MSRPRATSIVAGVAAGLAALSLGAAGAGAVAVPGPAAPTAEKAWIGAPYAPLVARAAPKARARVVWRVPLTTEFSRSRTRLLVTAVRRRGAVRWAQVLLPKRPNGSRGWVSQDALELTSTAVRVEIDVSARRLSVFRANRRVMRVPVAVGEPATPTPTGRWFAIAETLPGVPGAFLGDFILPITGFSSVLNEFAGGNGRVAIHGTSAPALIGTAASHGCVRMFNRDVKRLARLARPGTPLAIRA